MPLRSQSPNLDLRPSLIILNPKLELGTPLAAALDATGIRRLHVNPTGRYSKITPHANVNFWHHIYDAYYSPYPAHNKSVIPMVNKSMATMFPDPKGNDSSAAQFFADGSRSGGTVYKLDAIQRGKIPYPAELWEMLSCPDEFLSCIERAASGRDYEDPKIDAIARYTIAKAKGLLKNHQTKGLQRYFEEFRNNAEKQTAIYNTASHLARYGRDNSIPLSILRKERCALFIDTPTEYMDEYGPFQAQFIRSVLDMAKMTPGRTLHIIAEEAGNAGIKGLEDDLTIIRALNIKVDFIFQYEGQWAKLFDKEAEEALNSQMDVTIYGGVSGSDTPACRMISERAGKTTEIESHTTSSAGASSEATGIINFKVKDLISPDGVAKLPRHKQLVFVSNAKAEGVSQPVIKMDKVNYGQVLPHRDVIGFNHAANQEPLYFEDILIEMNYTPGEAPVCVNASDPECFEDDQPWTVDDEPFFTPASFLWLYILIGGIAATEFYAPFSLWPF